MACTTHLQPPTSNRVTERNATQRNATQRNSRQDRLLPLCVVFVDWFRRPRSETRLGRGETTHERRHPKPAGRTAFETDSNRQQKQKDGIARTQVTNGAAIRNSSAHDLRQGKFRLLEMPTIDPIRSAIRVILVLFILQDNYPLFYYTVLRYVCTPLPATCSPPIPPAIFCSDLFPFLYFVVLISPVCPSSTPGRQSRRHPFSAVFAKPSRPGLVLFVEDTKLPEKSCTVVCLRAELQLSSLAADIRRGDTPSFVNRNWDRRPA
ncbi:hypothetical protein B0T22DRAFT_50434 [Podospora appendiculata]|uniref:Uncharacterized protein n=1 Tax=Podospora appendiculata TaxID=314037 RepID=A0AAE0XI14_9PEZI|nr:hypothetical protein B0T22DRAFT_50434 [Podospora appendiculata]